MKDEPDGFIFNLFFSTIEERKGQVMPFEKIPDFDIKMSGTCIAFYGLMGEI